jgi:hypothetical protein
MTLHEAMDKVVNEKLVQLGGEGGMIGVMLMATLQRS